MLIRVCQTQNSIIAKMDVRRLRTTKRRKEEKLAVKNQVSYKSSYSLVSQSMVVGLYLAKNIIRYKYIIDLVQVNYIQLEI